MNLLTQNSKMKKTADHFGVRLFNFNMPAYKNRQTGKVVCPFAGSCKDFCYADKGFYKFSNTQKSLQSKHAITLQDNFADLMIKAIHDKRADFIRIHDSGDFYSPAYLRKWFEVMEYHSNVKFYAYTKSIPFFRDIVLPENFDIIFSFGGKLDYQIDINQDRHAKIFNNIDDLKNAGYVDASNYDLFATRWYNKNHRIGLIYH